MARGFGGNVPWRGRASFIFLLFSLIVVSHRHQIPTDRKNGMGAAAATVASAVSDIDGWQDGAVLPRGSDRKTGDDEADRGRNSAGNQRREEEYAFDWRTTARALGDEDDDVGELEGERERLNDLAPPLQLVRARLDHKLEVVQSTLDKLAEIKDPIAMIAAAGPYHGGKSFLLNVLLNSTLGFPVGVTPNPETRGLWIRIIPKDRVRGVDGSVVVLVDTEGLYGDGATRLYDAKIFALATLLSSQLIYNSRLGTLGDTQSVTALADLAKQAQVFNLHNWLHTGDALPSSDPAGSPSAGSAERVDSGSQEEETEFVDVASLLKTLDFPKLTWVVQGFDMDVESLHSPMDYLQRYLQALARTGDRSIDTLFSKGIACYPLRTPADLNLLREKWGSSGLAAEFEVFPYLHPGYIADLNRLRNGVFGNLTAKGGRRLTGQTIARVLPLLVHYVSEDFPLNTDRKVKEVMMDVMLEGAFSGAVQYFQARMDDALKKGGARGGVGLPHTKGVQETSTKKAWSMGSAGGGKVGDGVDGAVPAELRAVVASALTTEELDARMAAAEADAVAYCEKRCVGVVPERVTPICDAQLRAKISRMFPDYRTENDRRVNEALVAVGEGLRAKAEKDMDKLVLPMKDSEIERMCNLASKEAINLYDASVGKHAKGNLYAAARTRMKTDIKAKCSIVLTENGRLIQSVLKRAQSAFQSAYEDSVKAEGFEVMAEASEEGGSPPQSIETKKTGAMDAERASFRAASFHPVPVKRVDEIHYAAVKQAVETFGKLIKKEGLAWIGPGYDAYDLADFQNGQWSKRKLAEIKDMNEARIADLCRNLSRSLFTRYRVEEEKFQPFPDNEEALEAKSNEVAKKLGSEFVERTKDFSGAVAVEESRKDLVKAMEAEQSHMLRRNTALMTALCFDPLTQAYKELRMQDCERTYHNIWRTGAFWSTKCLWPGPAVLFGFRRTAYNTARRHLDQAQRSPPAMAGNDGRASTAGEPTTRGGGAMLGSNSGGGAAGLSSPAVSLSAAMKAKVIMSWIDHDLAKHANLVLTNCMMVSGSLGAMFIGGIWFLRSIFGGASNPTSGPIFAGAGADYYAQSPQFIDRISKGYGAPDGDFGSPHTPRRSSLRPTTPASGLRSR